MIFADGAGPRPRRAPARSTQSRTQDHVGGAQCRHGFKRYVTRRAGMQWVIGREARADFQVSDDAGAERFGERNAGLPRLVVPRGASRQDHDFLGRLQKRRGFAQRTSRRRGRNRGHIARRVDRRQRLGKLCLLHFGVEIDVDRALRRGVGDPGPAQQRFTRRGRRSRLVVPLGVFAHQCALIAGGVNPVDPRPALGGVDGTGGAEDEHRHAVAPGVEHRHGGVLKPNVGVHRRRHRRAGHLGVALPNSHCGLLVHAKQHLRAGIAKIIDDAVVQAAIARSGRYRDIGDVERPERVGDDVATKGRRVDPGRPRPLQGGYRFIGGGEFSCWTRARGRRGGHSGLLDKRGGIALIETDHEP